MSKVEEEVETYRRRLCTAKAMIVKFLKKNGFENDVNCKSKGKDYTYPLHEAVKQEKVTMVEMLIMFGAKPELTDYKGFTALQYGRTAQILKIFQVWPGEKWCMVEGNKIGGLYSMRFLEKSQGLQAKSNVLLLKIHVKFVFVDEKSTDCCRELFFCEWFDFCGLAFG